jgi:translocation and assembly module TamB
MDELGAKINLAIAPVPRAPGVPVSGKLNAGYSGKGNTVTLATSYIALPHTRVDLSGELNRQINVKAVSHNLADFQPVAGDIPVTLAPNGAVNLNATVAGNLSSPRIGANLAVTNFSAQGRPFNSLTADIAASPSNVAVTNAVIARNSLQMQLSANAGLRNWKPLPTNSLRADATIRNADVADVLALAEQTSIPATGAFTLDAHVNGTIGSPVGTVDVSATNGTIDRQKYDALTLHAEMTPNAITVPTLSLTSGPARLDANAQFQHPTNDMAQGTITAHVAANQVQLAQFQSLVKDRPGLAGSVTLSADGSATLHASQFDISSVTANVSARNLAMQGDNLGDFTATANTAGTAVQYNVTSNFAGSNIRVVGQSELNGDHRTSANANISNLQIERVLAVAGQRDLPVKGTFSATAQVSGTLQDPQATASFSIVNGAAYQESITRLEANATYNSREINVPRFHLEDGPATLDATLAFSHPANDLEDGDVRVHIASNQIQLSRLATVRQSQPGLAGVVQLTADAAGRLRKNDAPLFSTLNAGLRATGISMNRQNLGDLTASATTRGNAVAFNLASDIAKTNIKGSGTVELSSNYPVNAQLTFGNVTYRGLSPLLSQGTPAPLDASVEGSLNVSGPATDLNALNATLQLTKLEAHSAPASTLGAPPRINLNVENSGNIVVALNRGNVTLQNFHLAGHDADLTLSGSAALAGNQALNLHANGNVNLEVLEGLSNDIYSSGKITLVANVAGTPAKPDLTGQVQLQNASFNMLDLPNGISNANGTVVFNGTDAYIRNITGESGGGKLVLTGTVGLGEQMLFHTQLAASGVRVNYPDTITTQLDANVAVNGTSVSSLVTGTVTVTGVSLHSGADVGNVLTAAAAPPSTSSGTGGVLAGMRLDVRIVTAPGAQIRTTLTQNLQAEANLTLLGTPSNPGMIGRVNVTEGDIVFFGSKYTINQGSITFSNSSKINPRLNIDLETTVQGIDVTLTVSGPVDKMKLSYRSDPPLQFQQIVSLLASGSTPTTDPVIAAHAPAAPQQSLEQSGASAVLGNAVANPVSGRLQRLFGVSKLSIDPQIVGGNTAQATLTLQQQITKDLTFTYIEDVTNSNPQVIRAEWNINPHYSAVAQRDVNGEVIVDLFYKKRFK